MPRKRDRSMRTAGLEKQRRIFFRIFRLPVLPLRYPYRI